MAFMLAGSVRRTDVGQAVASPLRGLLAGRWPLGVDALPLAYYLIVAASLAAIRYPAWRIAIVLLAAGLQQLQLWRWRHASPGCCVAKGGVQLGWAAVLCNVGLFVTTGLTAAVTGGVRSPLLVTFIAPYFAALVLVGDRRETRWLLGGTATGVVALALLPSAWIGPVLPAPLHPALVALSVLGVGALLAPLHATLRQGREELSRTREEMAAEALTRARSLEQVGAKVAHELKNPLAAVKALVQLGLHNAPESTSHERLAVIESEVTRMQEILRDYLSFTRPLQEIKPRQIQLGPLVTETLLVLSARAIDRGVRLTSGGDAAAVADPRRIREALLNLVANAIEATPSGGEVFVEVRSTGERVEVVIRDTGRGMPREVLQRIGTPFFTTREEGTGLGVVLARSVVAQHHGELLYESAPGHGTTVTAILPAPQNGADSSAARAAG